MQQIRPPFLRSSAHPAGPNSPLSNPIIPGIGPPLPPRTLGPPSSPMHRPLLSPHVHPSSNPNPGMMPHPGIPMTGLPPFPPVNMMPNGPIPFPPMMNFGMPSLAPLVPPPTLLVPYPVIVPLPVPIPIPIPVPFNPKTSRDQPESSGQVRNSPRSSEALSSGSHSLGASGGDREEQSCVEHLSPGWSGSEKTRTKMVDLTVKAEDNSRTPCMSDNAKSMDEVIDLTVGQRQHVIHSGLLAGVQVKVEAEFESRSSPAEGQYKEAKCSQDRVEGGISERLLKATKDEGGTKTHTLESAPPSSNNSPSYSASQAVSQHNSYHSNLTPQSIATMARSQLLTPSRDQSSPAALCNVIVNGTGWHPVLPPAFEMDRRVEGAASEGHMPPANGELDRDALKENNCSVEEWEPSKRGSGQDEDTIQGEGKPDLDSNLEEGEHAYALPLLSTGGCVVIQPVPKAGADKTAYLSCSISAPLSGAGSPELEPPLKRRCLRIRNQNK